MPSLDAGLLDPFIEILAYPPLDTSPLPSLKTSIGLGCNYCPQVSKDKGKMKQHFNVNHAPIRRNRGGVKANARGYLLERLNQERFGDKPLWSPASYHRFFIAIKGSS
jgi:hypothetical protein